MIDLLIITSLILSIIYSGYICFRKDFYSYLNYIVIGIYIPLILYFFSWSNIINKNYSNDFILIFIYFNIIFTLFIIVNFNKKYSAIRIRNYSIQRFSLLYFINIFYILILILENYLLTGYFIPLLKGIDIHTKSFSATLALLITKNTIPLLLINFLFYIKDIRNLKNNLCLFFNIVLILIPIITKGARHNSIQEIFIIIIFLYPLLKNKLFLLVKKNLKYILLFFIIIGGMSNYRSNKVYKLPRNYGVYKDWIRYTGPFKNIGIFTTYYGYYPMSINNLNLSIGKNKEKFEINMIGLNSYRGIYILVNKMLGRDPYFNSKDRVYAVTAATVPTGFFDFYSDYKEYTYIPILLSFIISQFFSEILLLKKNVLVLGLYSIFNMAWLDMMFLNSLFRDMLLPSLLIYVLFFKIFIKNKKIRSEKSKVHST